MTKARFGRTLHDVERGAAVLALMGVVASCGGGGSSDDGGGLTPTETDGIRTSAAERDANFGIGLINAEAAYERGAGGAGVTIAIIDSGVDLDHPDLAANTSATSIDLFGRPLDRLASSHGTGVAGVAAAVANSEGVVGVAPEARILSVRAEDDDGVYFDSRAAEAIDYAVANGAQIINMSFNAFDVREPTAAYAQALQRAADRGVLVTISAGNNGDDDPRSAANVAGRPEFQGLVLAVGAVDANREIWGPSNRAGANAEAYLTGPGVSVVTTADGGGYQTVSGTSFAAPHVAGAAAALKSAFPSLSMRQIADLLLRTASDLGAAGVDPVYGAGLIDLARALEPDGAMAMASGERVEDGRSPLADSVIELGPAMGDALASSEVLARGMALDALDRPYRYDYRQRVRDPEAALSLERLVGLDQVDDRAIDASDSLGETLLADRASFTVRPGRRLVGLDAPNARFSADRGAFGAADRTRLIEENREGELVEARLGWSSGAYRADVALGRGLDADDRPAARSAVFEDRRHASLVEQDYAASVGRRVGENGALRFSAGGAEDGSWRAAAGYRHETALGAFSLGVASADENDAALGFSGDGGFALDANERSNAVTLGWAGEANGLEFAADVEWAWSDGAEGRAIAVDDVGAMAFGVSAARRDVFRDDDRVSLALRQPLRAETGTISVDAPVAATLDGGVARARETLSAEPSGRELDIELGYGFALEDAGRLQFNAGMALEPGHVDGADPEFAFGARYSVRF